MVKAVGLTCIINFEVAVSPRKVQMRNKFVWPNNKPRLHSIGLLSSSLLLLFFWYTDVFTPSIVVHCVYALCYRVQSELYMMYVVVCG